MEGEGARIVRVVDLCRSNSTERGFFALLPGGVSDHLDSFGQLF
jgi:hypothetical protein